MNEITQKVSRGLFWTYAERMSSQLVTLLVTIVLARLIAPEEYGIIAIVTIFITIADAFVTSGFGNALIQKKDADDIDFSSMLFFSIIFSTLIYGILFFVAPIISNFFEIKLLTLVIRIMGIRLPIAAINSIQHAYLSKQMKFRKFFVSTVGGTLVSAIIGIIMAVCGLGIWALVAQYLSNAIIGTIVLFFTSGWKPMLVYSQKRINKLFSFGWKIMLVGVMTSVYSNIKNLIIGKKYSSEDLAYSTKGEQFPSTISGSINSSISKVLYPVLANSQDDKASLKRIMRRSITVGNFVLFPILCGLAAVAGPFVEALLTEKWNECVPYLQIMCLVYALQPIQTSSLQVIKAVGKGNLFVVIDIIKKVLGIALLLITVFLFDSVIAIIIGVFITEIVSTLLNFPINKKLINYKYHEQLLDLIRPIAYILIMWIAIYCFSFIQMNIFLKLLSEVLVGAGVYLASAILSRDPTLKYLLDIIRNFRKGKETNDA